MALPCDMVDIVHCHAADAFIIDDETARLYDMAGCIHACAEPQNAAKVLWDIRLV